MLLLSVFSPQYGLFWAICPFPIIKYIHTYIIYEQRKTTLLEALKMEVGIMIPATLA